MGKIIEIRDRPEERRCFRGGQSTQKDRALSRLRPEPAEYLAGPGHPERKGIGGLFPESLPYKKLDHLAHGGKNDPNFRGEDP